MALQSVPTRVRLVYADMKEAPTTDVVGNVVLGIEEPTPERVAIVLEFSEKGLGFGQITIVQTPDGVAVDTECMGTESVRRYLGALLDGAVTDCEEDAERAERYRRIMTRESGG